MSDGRVSRTARSSTRATRCKQATATRLVDSAPETRADSNLSLAAAAERGIISAYIVMSPTVYGPGLGPGNSECGDWWPR
jgi:hypothetical protein